MIRRVLVSLFAILFSVTMLNAQNADSAQKAAANGIQNPNAQVVQPQTPTAEPQIDVQKLSPIDVIMLGGWVMIPLVIFLLLVIFYAVERTIVISKAGKFDRNFMNNIRDYLHSGRIDAAREFCRTSNTPVSRVIEKGISRLGKKTEEVQDAMETAGRIEITRVEKNLHVLGLISKIAPMLGFIGTIIGVVTIFYDISLSGDIAIKTISGGLYQKMVSSGAGLVVGVLAFVGYHLLNTRIDRVASQIERTSLEFIDLISEPGK